jgi:hypothetical protein
MPPISEAMICNTLWSNLGTEMGLEDACSGQESLLFEPPEVYYLFPT